VPAFCAYAPFLALLPIFKSILEVLFCEGVQHLLRFCLDHLNNVQMVAFQFYLQSRKQREVGWVEGPWCQRKSWTCFWLCSSLVSPFLVWVSLYHLPLDPAATTAVKMAAPVPEMMDNYWLGKALETISHYIHAACRPW
jgi:hypothetical protein